MIEDTGELAVKMARINAKLFEQQQAKALEQAAKVEREKEEKQEQAKLHDRRTHYRFATGVSLGAAAALSVLYWFEVIHVPNGVISWLSAGLSVIFFLAGGFTLMSIYHRVTIKKIDDRAEDLRHEIRDARPADAIELGRLVALHLETQAMVEHNELQRQSDVAQIREASVKRLDELHDQVRRVEKRCSTQFDAMVVISQNQATLYEVLEKIHGCLARQESSDPIDPKYLADMSECVRLGEEIAMRKLRPPDEPNPN